MSVLHNVMVSACESQRETSDLQLWSAAIFTLLGAPGDFLFQVSLLKTHFFPWPQWPRHSAAHTKALVLGGCASLKHFLGPRCPGRGSGERLYPCVCKVERWRGERRVWLPFPLPDDTLLWMGGGRSWLSFESPPQRFPLWNLDSGLLCVLCPRSALASHTWLFKFKLIKIKFKVQALHLSSHILSPH